MTAIKQLAPQKRETLAILSAARPFLTTSAEITIKGQQIQPWLSSTTTRSARRQSLHTPPRPDRECAARLVPRRILFAPKPPLAQKRPSLAARRAQIVPCARHAHTARAPTPQPAFPPAPCAPPREAPGCAADPGPHTPHRPHPTPGRGGSTRRQRQRAQPGSRQPQARE